jgi:indole-3-glycerol phosphate synthase
MSNQPGLTQTGTVLDRIMAHKLEENAARQNQLPRTELESRLPMAPPVRDFVATLQRDTVALIAEVKRASPSKGRFLEDFDALDIARTYEKHGAAAISVLTDERFFQGHLDDLQQVRTAVSLPILRKEFILDPYQVIEARVAGADAILLIVACLEDALLQDLFQQASDLGMAALIEIHNEAEMERALALSPTLVGINNRNLHTFDVDLSTTIRLATLCDSGVTLVGESGIHTAADVQLLAGAGCHAILVGESLILAENRPAKVSELSGVKSP